MSNKNKPKGTPEEIEAAIKEHHAAAKSAAEEPTIICLPPEAEGERRSYLDLKKTVDAGRKAQDKHEKVLERQGLLAKEKPQKEKPGPL